ncbi:MAG: hypothetical protein H6529_09900 [Nocardioides sp.]|nr:hypothetical protein [Nocardioidaceae bacterium]MCB8956779.1 hypothetical protein [Nocardioides sp.]
MPKKIIAALTVVLAALLLTTTPVVAEAGKLITGKQIKDNTVTGKDVKESSLGTVPKAGSLANLPSGKTESGAFSAAAGNSSAGGWLGFSINFIRPLSTPIDESHIIDTTESPDAANCPGPGQAAPGYLCLYSNARSNVGEIYGYSTSGPYAEIPGSVGIGLYVPVTGGQPYVDGIWTVTAP